MKCYSGNLSLYLWHRYFCISFKLDKTRIESNNTMKNLLTAFRDSRQFSIGDKLWKDLILVNLMYKTERLKSKKPEKAKVFDVLKHKRPTIITFEGAHNTSSWFLHTRIRTHQSIHQRRDCTWISLAPLPSFPQPLASFPLTQNLPVRMLTKEQILILHHTDLPLLLVTNNQGLCQLCFFCWLCPSSWRFVMKHLLFVENFPIAALLCYWIGFHIEFNQVRKRWKLSEQFCCFDVILRNQKRLDCS